MRLRQTAKVLRRPASSGVGIRDGVGAPPVPCSPPAAPLGARPKRAMPPPSRA